MCPPFFCKFKSFLKAEGIIEEASLNFIAKLIQYPPEKLTYFLKIQGLEEEISFWNGSFSGLMSGDFPSEFTSETSLKAYHHQAGRCQGPSCVGWVFCCATEVDLRTSPSKKWRPKSRKLTRNVFVGEHMENSMASLPVFGKIARFKSDGSVSIDFWWYTIWIHVFLYPWVGCPFLGGFVRIPNQQASLSIITGGLKFS